MLGTSNAIESGEIKNQNKRFKCPTTLKQNIIRHFKITQTEHLIMHLANGLSRIRPLNLLSPLL